MENEIIIYQTQDGKTKIDVKIEDETVWLTQAQMADKSNVLRDKIAKIEAGIYQPNIKSLFKILGPLGYTIKIERIQDDRK